MTSTSAIIAIAVAAVALAIAIWFLMRDKREDIKEDNYIRGLEAWLEGDHQEALAAMRRATEEDRRSVEPYLQLGNLLRTTGDPDRAAKIHRTLMVRPRLTSGQRVSITLALVEDNLALRNWADAGRLLDEVGRGLRGSARYWRLRFRQLDGQGDRSGAANVLHDASRKLKDKESRTFACEFEYYQMDRVMAHIRASEHEAARHLLKSLKDKSRRQDLISFLYASACLAAGEVEQAATTATEAILVYPGLSDLLLPVLQKALFAGGNFDRVIPILEAAVQEPGAPVSLVISLAQLYEKVGDREQAVSLIESRAKDPDLTPDAAAPYLRVLVKDLPASDFSRVWSCLRLSTPLPTTSCHSCGATRDGITWYCSRCGTFSLQCTGDRRVVKS